MSTKHHAAFMTQRYCIGCRHLQYTDKRICSGSSWTGSWTAEEAALSCKHGLWKQHLNEDRQLDLQKAMEMAQDCAHYEERPEDI